MLGFLSTFRQVNRAEGERHLRAKNFRDAEEYFKRAVEEADQRRHSVHQLQCRLLLAEAQRHQGKLLDAEQVVRTALAHTAKASNPSGYVQCLDALAEIFHTGGNFAATEKALQEGVRIEASMPHPNPLRMARRVHRLGVARHANGRSEDAIPALEKAVTLHEQICGKDHADTATVLADLAAVHRALSIHEDARGCDLQHAAPRVT